jgi:hypothetical protein
VVWGIMTKSLHIFSTDTIFKSILSQWLIRSKGTYVELTDMKGYL